MRRRKEFNHYGRGVVRRAAVVGEVDETCESFREGRVAGQGVAQLGLANHASDSVGREDHSVAGMERFGEKIGIKRIGLSQASSESQSPLFRGGRFRRVEFGFVFGGVIGGQAAGQTVAQEQTARIPDVGDEELMLHHRSYGERARDAEASTERFTFGHNRIIGGLDYGPPIVRRFDVCRGEFASDGFDRGLGRACARGESAHSICDPEKRFIGHAKKSIFVLPSHPPQVGDGSSMKE